MSFRLSPEHIAKGHKRTAGCEYRKTVITLDDETFDEVRQMAVANGCSFTAQARVLIEVGLETIKQDLVA